MSRIDAQPGEGFAFDDFAVFVEAFDDEVKLDRSGNIIRQQRHADPALQFDLVGRRIDVGDALR